MAHTQNPDFVFRRNGGVRLNRRGRQFSRLLAAELCASVVVNAGYAMFRGSVKCTGYPLHSAVSPSLPLPWVTMCHHVSTGLYYSLVMRTAKNFLSLVKHELAPGSVHLFTLVLCMTETFERCDIFTALF